MVVGANHPFGARKIVKRLHDWTNKKRETRISQSHAPVQIPKVASTTALLGTLAEKVFDS